MSAQTCKWYALCGNTATALVTHPVLGEVPTCWRCIEKHNMGARVVALLIDGKRAGCLDVTRGGCQGGVELRDALSATGIRYPRCAQHWTERLAEQRRIAERYPEQAPADFDPSYAGESWDEP